MKICITATGQGLDAEVDPRFGRCQYFTVVDPDTMQFESIENSSIAASGGAGIQAAQFVANKGVKVVLTGNAGPNAYNTLEAADISVITGVSGKVRQAVEDYKNGKLQPPTSGPSVSAHFGMGRGTASASGQGSGPGLGMSRTGEKGKGVEIRTTQPSKDDEFRALKEELQVLKSQLDGLMGRIDKQERRECPTPGKQVTGFSKIKEALKDRPDTTDPGSPEGTYFDSTPILFSRSQ
jgi:predicted Fe-Mo cluster-binding NifX family protein